MRPGTITWTQDDSNVTYTGKVGGFAAFTISYGLHRSATPWSLRTRLPVASAALRMGYTDPEEAKAAAAKLWRTWWIKTSDPA